MIHLSLHFVVPLLVAFVFYRSSWRSTGFILIATMLVDLDHLLANPIYDASRCSIGFHPLHTTYAILVYVAMLVVPMIWCRVRENPSPVATQVHFVGLGLLIHMALDGIDCVL